QAAPARTVLGAENWDPEVFAHSVASGDPTASAVIIWTRVTPTKDAHPGPGKAPDVALTWEGGGAPGLRDVAASGTVTARAESDHTVKVDATGLGSATSFFYRCRADMGERKATSRVGRTRTVPGAGDDVSAIRFGVCSWSNYEA